MHRFTRGTQPLLILLMALSAISLATAQEEGEEKTPQFNFRDTPVDNVLKYLSDATGRAVVKKQERGPGYGDVLGRAAVGVLERLGVVEPRRRRRGQPPRKGRPDARLRAGIRAVAGEPAAML